MEQTGNLIFFLADHRRLIRMSSEEIIAKRYGACNDVGVILLRSVWYIDDK
jgi:hypothetical protein